MNSLLSGLSAYVPAALTILCATTVLLIAGLAVQHAADRPLPAMQSCFGR